MKNISINHIPVLVSSQIFPEEYDVPVLKYKMPILDRSSGEDRKLFEQIYRSKDGHLPLEGNLFEDLLNQLDGHPLSIILTATQAANAASWNTVLEHWEQAHQKTRNSRHNSRDAALMMSWNGVRDDDPFCTEIWGLSALCREELNYSDLMELAHDNKEEKGKFNTAIGKLRNASLIDWTENGTALKMLQPVKKAFFLLADKSEKISCVKRWYDYYSSILDKANNLKDMNRNKAHISVVENLSQILYFLEQMLLTVSDELPQLIVHFTLKAYNYFGYSAVSSAHILKKLACFGKKIRDNYLLANTLQSLGDLSSRLGDTDKALDYYSEAKELYEKEKDNLGLANTLQSLGMLYIIKNELHKSIDSLKKAKLLYEAEQEPYGASISCAILSKLVTEPDSKEYEKRAYELLEKLPDIMKEVILSILR